MAPTALAYAGTEPIANSSDPMANRMAIHHPRALGAHHVEPTAGFWCLRWWRDSHRTVTPSGRTRSTNVAGAPTLSMWPLRFRVVMTASHPWRSNHHPAPGLVLLAIGVPGMSWLPQSGPPASARGDAPANLTGQT